MALSEFELARFDKSVRAFLDRRRPPPHIRKKLDLGHRWKGQSVEIFEIRPHWQDPDTILEHSVAKATYVKAQAIWKIYWQRADLRWHRYEPHKTAKTIEEFLHVVDEDRWACFFG